jgi:hypothetical protein
LAVIFLIASSAVAFAADNTEKFPLKDVSVEYDSDIDMSMVQGEITNNSGKSYEAAIFKLSFYDADGKLLGAADVAIENFEKDETVTFDGISEKNLQKWKSYKIRLELSV